MTSSRETLLKQWLDGQLESPYTLSPLKGDASFRRYFRVTIAEGSDKRTLMAVDAPPDREDCEPFIRIAEKFSTLGIPVPRIHSHDLDMGFMLIDDFGDQLLLPNLNSDSAEHLYQCAFTPLATIQTCDSSFALPVFDQAFMMEELNHFITWYLEAYLKLTLSSAAKKSWQDELTRLAREVSEQPYVCVHRDYHSRNLMLLPNRPSHDQHEQHEQIGVIDFQDAVWGPVTYDLVSLLRDCYIDWPSEEVTRWASDFLHDHVAKQSSSRISEEQFLRWFDLTGCQRHLKAMFIFARKYVRDHNDLYLADIPRTLNYALKESQAHPELQTLHRLLSELPIGAAE